MDLVLWEDILKKTLADGRISDGEKRSIESLLEPIGQDEQKLGLLRNLAFRLVRQEDGQPAASWLDWLEDVAKLLVPRRVHAATRLAQTWFAPQDPIADRIVDLFHDVKREALVCVFTITDDRISNAILNAHQRGVQVRILTDNQKALDLGSDIERLERAGIAVRQDRTEAHMHHKFALFDGRSLLNGSYNWTRGASQINMENVVLHYDPVVVASFSRYFEWAWERLA